MPAPLVATAAPALAQPIMESVSKILSTDIVRVKGIWYRRVRLKEPHRSPDGSLKFTKTGRVKTHMVERYDPVEITGSVNGMSLLAGAAAALVASMAWEGLELHTGLGNVTLVPGLKDKVRPTEENLATKTCDELRPTLFEQLFVPAAVAAKTAVARAAGCAWAQG